jgi:maltooligosyltrehalose trehalohydrolase
MSDSGTLKKLGANVLEESGEIGFLVWAPNREKVSLEILAPHEETVQMEKVERGYFQATVADPGGEVEYFYVLDGEARRPDPASRHQPRGVHGPSAVVRHGEFRWEDGGCLIPELRDYITYELHVGTFTREGTFEAVVPRIPYLKELGITAVELMPVAQFPGSRNWGYDGVHPFAVQDTYGGPGQLKGLVNELHKNGIAAILDVVYNHLGPEGNYLWDYGPYFTSRYHSPWGDAVNFDGPGSSEVRRFFIENACYWFERFHLDALRIDAIHGIIDMSAKHFLKELKETVDETVKDRPAYVIAESDLNDVRAINPPGQGGYGLDGQWNDDFHHALHTLLTGEDLGYYTDFGSVGQMAKALREGFVYTWEYSKYRARMHGSSTAERPPRQLVVFSQNHDQVGNRMLGDRLSAGLPLGKLKLAAALVLLSPNLPLLFMGEEYGEKAPFQYFISHSDPGLVEAVRNGRREEFSGFLWQGELPDPQSEDTFNRSRIDPGLRHEGGHRELFEFYKALIALRKRHPALGAAEKGQTEVAEHPEQRAVVVRRWKGEAQAFFAASFNEEPVTLGSGLPGGKWRELISSSPGEGPGRESGVSDIIDGEIRLEPFGFRLYEPAGNE